MQSLRNNLSTVYFGPWKDLIHQPGGAPPSYFRIRKVNGSESFCRLMQSIIFAVVANKSFALLRTHTLNSRFGYVVKFFPMIQIYTACATVVGNSKTKKNSNKILLSMLLANSLALIYFGHARTAAIAFGHFIIPIYVYRLLQISMSHLPIEVAPIHPIGAIDPNKKKLLDAIKSDNWELTKKLLNSGISMDDFKGPLGNTKISAIHLAVMSGSQKVIQGLLDRYPEQINKIDNPIYGFSPLHYAALFQTKEICHLLLQKGADLELASKHKHTPVLIAASYHNLDTLKFLISKKAKMDLVDWEGDSALHLAIQNRGYHVKGLRKDDSRGCVEAILETAPNIELKNQYGITALQESIKVDNLAILDLLIANGAKLNTTTREGMKSIHIAILFNAQACLEKLQQNYGLTLEDTNEKGETVFHFAAKLGKTEAITRLIQLGFSVNVTDKQGNTPLHVAVINGKKEFVQAILNRGVDTHAKNNQGDTALHLAASNIYVDEFFDEWSFIPILLPFSNPNIQNYQGLTPLHKAIICGYSYGVKQFLDKSASVTIRDASKKNAVMIAIEYGQFHLLHQLLKIDNFNILKIFEQRFPDVVMSSGPITVFVPPCGGKTWFHVPTELNFSKFLEIPFLFHDVELAQKIFPYLSPGDYDECISYLEKKYTKEMVAWLRSEKAYYDKGLKIQQDHFKITAEKLIPPAPNYITFDSACEILLGLTKRVQNDDTSLPGYVTMGQSQLKDEVNTLFHKVKDRLFDECITGKKDTPAGIAFYAKMENMIRHVALLLADPENPLRLQAKEERLKKNDKPLPDFDDDHRATVLKDFALGSRVCGTGGTGEVFSAYDFLQGNKEAGNVMLEDKVAKVLEELRERIVARLISTQKGKYGEEIPKANHVHMGLQIRKLLGIKRGIRGHDVAAEKDSCDVQHLTEELIVNAFDKYYTIDAILDEMDEAINGEKDPQGKRTGKRIINNEDLFSWLTEHFASPDSQKRSQIGNELENALKEHKKAETEEKKNQLQAKIIQLATELGKPEIATKPYGAAIEAARDLASEARNYIDAQFFKEDEVTLVPEITREGIKKLLLHPKMGILVHKE